MSDQKSAEARHHLYPDAAYGETPVLGLPNSGSAASTLARLLTKVGVDGREPRAMPATSDEVTAGNLRLQAMLTAAATAGFMVDVRFANTREAGTVRAYYSYTSATVGLTIADRPPGTPGRMFNLQWIQDDKGMYQPRSDDDIHLEACAEAYDNLHSLVTEPGINPALAVVRARLLAYQRPTQQPADGVDATAL